jgi:hypothetical protein
LPGRNRVFASALPWSRLLVPVRESKSALQGV